MRQWVEDDPPKSSLNPSGSRFRIHTSRFALAAWPGSLLLEGSADRPGGPQAASANPTRSQQITVVSRLTISSPRCAWAPGSESTRCPERRQTQALRYHASLLPTPARRRGEGDPEKWTPFGSLVTRGRRRRSSSRRSLSAWPVATSKK